MRPVVSATFVTSTTCLVIGVFLSSSGSILAADTLHRVSNSTLTPLELDRGETLEFTLQNGQTRTLTLLDTWARVLLTNLDNPRKGFFGGGTVYAFGCHVRIDGQPMQMVRYVPVQASFYEPYVIDGVRIWFDGVRKIGELFNETHGECVPRKDARFAVQDATSPICADEEMRPWYPNGENRIDVQSCYHGDDTWMGTYYGADLHGGLDVNMPIGTPLWAPISFDDQFFFNSLDMGHNNNRWRAIRRWDNGQRWVLQTHHITRLIVPERTPLKQGSHFAVAAGVLTGAHAHSHFVFKIGEENEEVLLDPWILFWQIFENNKRRAGAIRAEIAPFQAARTGEAVRFHATGSKPSVMGNQLSYRWTFGDGGGSVDAAPTHVYAKSGVYPVTLVVSDAVRLDSTTQHICVNGPTLESTVLALHAPDECEFAPRPIPAMDVYEGSPKFIPHTLRFVARHRSLPRPASKLIEVKNLGGGVIGDVDWRVEYEDLEGWIEIDRRGVGNAQTLAIRVDAGKFSVRHGVYHALVHVECPGALNSPQSFAIELTTPVQGPSSELIVDNGDDACYRSPYFWLSPRFHGPWPSGYRGTYLVAGEKAVSEGFVRFQPDLAKGVYEVSFHEQTPFRPTKQTTAQIRFPVRVHHKNGVEVVWVEPLKSLRVGTFEFHEGTDGFVQVETAGATGLVVADAVRFTRAGASENPHSQ